MADTALTIIQDAFELIKIYAPGQQANAADSARALSCLNEMLEQWSNQPYACYANKEQSFSLVPGQQTYTIGLSGGANIAATRPISILSGRGAAYLVDANQNRYPVDVIEQDVWNSIGRLNNTSQLPDTLFYNPQFPLGILNVFPLPLIAYTMYFDARLQLVNLSNLNTAFSLPPGYRAAVKNNLAVMLWPYYKQSDPPVIVVRLAVDALANVKRMNIKQSPATYDEAIISKANSTYNIYSDSNTGGRNQ